MAPRCSGLIPRKSATELLNAMVNTIAIVGQHLSHFG